MDARCSMAGCEASSRLVAAVWLAGVACGTVAVRADDPPLAAPLREIGVEVVVRDGMIVEARAENLSTEGYSLVGQCVTLRKLAVSGAELPLSDETLPLLAGLVELEELNTNQSALTDEGYRHFAALKNLRRLHLFHPSPRMSEFTGRGLAHLAALPRLEYLTFAGTTVGDEALAAVGTLSGLRGFRTWHTGQTKAGTAELTKLANLTFLRIGQRLPRPGNLEPSLDGSTIATLAAIRSLERLELTEARLTAADLAPLAGLPKLERLDMHVVEIPAADVEQLRTKLPGVKIDFKPLTDEERESILVRKLKL